MLTLCLDMMAEKDHSYARQTLREARMWSAKLGCEVRSYDAKLGCEVQSEDAKCEVILLPARQNPTYHQNVKKK